MLCLRYFIPALLAANAAPPLFYIAFIVALVLYKRPCFYCVINMIALSRIFWLGSMVLPWKEQFYVPREMPAELVKAGYEAFRFSWLQLVFRRESVYIPLLGITWKL